MIRSGMTRMSFIDVRTAADQGTRKTVRIGRPRQVSENEIRMPFYTAALSRCAMQFLMLKTIYLAEDAQTENVLRSASGK